jgi:HK97 family phage major capsid protein
MADRNPFITRQADGSQNTAALEAGGNHLIPSWVPELVLDRALVYSGVAGLASVSRANAETEVFRIFGGRPEAYGVGQTEQIPTTGAEHTKKSIVAEKMATIIPWSSEYSEDINDPDSQHTAEVVRKVGDAFADKVDYEVIGARNGVVIGSPLFGGESLLNQVTQTVSLAGDSASDMEDAIADAIYACETSDADPASLSVLLSRDLSVDIRKQKEAETSKRRLYSSVEELTHGLPYSFTKHLLGMDEEAGTTVAIVGPFSDLVHIKVLRDLEAKLLDQGTVGDYNLAEQDMEAMRWTMRAACGILLPSKFRRIVFPTP